MAENKNAVKTAGKKSGNAKAKAVTAENHVTSAEKNNLKNNTNNQDIKNGGEKSAAKNEEIITKKDCAPAKAVKSILFAVSECQPFIATGGLADVAGSLPKAVATEGTDVRVMLPLYADMEKIWRDRLSFIGSTHVGLAWRKQYCGIFSYKQGRVTYYFIDNEYYFKRHGLYGHYDDGERFAFFSKSVIDVCLFLHYYPDIIHCNDWQTGLIPIYLKSIYTDCEKIKGVKTVFTIHNIEYQGKFSMDILEDVLAVPFKYASLVEYGGNVNIIKGAIQCCGAVTTVSPTYAKEIMTPEFSYGLHFVLRDNSAKLRGILNGIDYESYNPLTDRALFKNYDAGSAAFKAENKKGLQKLFNLPQDEKIPMIAIITRLVQHKGMDLVKAKIEDIMREKVQVVLLGKGDIAYENLFLDLQNNYSEKLRAVMAYNPDLARKIYSAADIFLMPSKSEPCGLAQMIASRYGAVPVIRETGGLADSIKDIGLPGGNGFTFANYNANDMYNRIIHALTLYENREEWAGLVKRVMNTDFTWNTSAKQYIKLYGELI